MVADLGTELYYLASEGAGGYGVVVLERGERRWAAVFRNRALARRLARQAPDGVEVGTVPAGDPHAREDFLLACVQAGADRLLLDPPAEATDPDALPTHSVRDALAAVRSLRTGSACL